MSSAENDMVNHTPLEQNTRQERRRVIKADQYREMSEANELLQKAKSESQEIIAAAHREAADITEGAWKHGQEKGRQELLELILAQKLHDQDIWQRIEHSIVNMIVECLQRLLGDVGERDCLLPRIRHILEEIHPRKTVTLYVHVNEVDVVQRQLRAWQNDFGKVELFLVKPDPLLAPADCIIETESGIVDGRLKAQLETIRESLQAVLRIKANAGAA